MAVPSFTKVPILKPGTPVSSTHLAKVADAINDRLRLNAGDAVERIVFYALSLFRQIRNSDGGSIFPPYAEFFFKYQMMRATQAEFPVEGPGDPEGANLSSFMPAFVFGADAIDLASEDLRIADEASGGVPLTYGGGVPTALADIWALGKLQRGAMDPGTGAVASPSFHAAVEHYKIRASPLSPHGNSWGGYMPIPEELSPCSDPLYPNYKIFFTNLDDGSIYPPGGYPGTCPDEPTHVAAVISTPRYYFIWLNNGELDILDSHDWIQGPYTGGANVKRQFGDHLPRVLNAFSADFRGTAAERAAILAGEAEWDEFAFDTQRFNSQQYQLAPARGTEDEEGVTPIYPFFELSAADGTSIAAGSLLTCSQTGTTSYSFGSGFVFASVYLKTTKLAAPIQLEFLNFGTVIHTETIEPDGTGLYERIVTFAAPVQATPLEIRVKAAGSFTDGTGYIRAECSELYEYKPETHDLYLVQRLGSCRTSPVNNLDGSGEDQSHSNQISDEYFLYGCVLNSHGVAGPAGSAAEINTNAVYDAARRLSQGVRIMPRAQLLDYEVIETATGEKSICYFNRLATDLGVEVDLFEGIAPARAAIASGSIQWGVPYIVRDAAILYGGRSWAVGQTFTGLRDVTEFAPVTEGDTPTVYEKEGIRATAPPQQFTNEWLMSAWLKVYRPDEESEWKPDAYSDYFSWSERCHFYHGGVGYTQLQRQFDYGQNLSVAPEALPGWRYAKNTNRWECEEDDEDCKTRRRHRYKSCRIYEPAPEIESVVAVEGEPDVVKVTFKTRFHHHSDAPASIARDRTGWNVTALRAEASEYRTLENGLREYLVYRDGDGHCTGGSWDGSNHNLSGQGNSAFFRNADVDVWSIPDNPHGACFPDFYFVRLQAKPFEDGNIKQDRWDTPLWADWWREADLKIRPMCEGFVDGATSARVACGNFANSLFCYTFENLCFDAFGGKWFTALATTATSRIRAADTRSDAPMGFGQLPNTLLSSECYNQFSRALNLLTKIQIMLPTSFQTRSWTGASTKDVTATWPTPTPTCTTSGLSPAYFRGAAPDGGTLTPGVWEDSTVVASSHGGGISCSDCNGDSWIMLANRLDQEWRWALIDPDALNAVPEAWQGLFTADGDTVYLHSARLFGLHRISEVTTEVETVNDIEDSSHCGQDAVTGDPFKGAWIDGDGYLKFTAREVDYSLKCEIVGNAGFLRTRTIGDSVYAIGRDIYGGSCCSGAFRDESVEPIIGDDTTFVEIPLVPPGEVILPEGEVIVRITYENEVRETAEGDVRVPRL